MKGWYEDYRDLRRDMIRQNLDEVHFYEENKNITKSNNCNSKNYGKYFGQSYKIDHSQFEGNYEEDRDLITSDDECSRCPHQVNCCGQCQGNYEEN